MNPSYRIEQVDNPTPEAITSVKDGIRNYNHQHGYEDLTPVAVFLRDTNQTIVGGVYGELGLDWLYIDLLWVADSHKKQGYGRQLMHSIEQYSLEQGTSNIHLATTSFQSLPFYYHVGYRLFGLIEDRPPGHNYYYLHKQIHKLTTNLSGRTPLDVVVRPPREDVLSIARGLSQHNKDKGISSNSHKVHIFLKDNNDNILGGLLGAIYWGWLDLQTFWVHDALRQQGYGTQILAIAEQIAHEHNAPHIILDVVDFQGLPFFGHRGFSTFATLRDRPKGHTTYFLAKHL